MPPKTPKAKPRSVPRRGTGTTAPDTTPGPEPSASPATAPSAGEAIQTQAPIAPPAGRLDSLVSSTSSRNTQGGIMGGDSDGRGVPVPLKFKPRNVPRKSKEEREALDAKFEAILTPIPRPRGGTSSRGPRGGRGGRSGFGRNDRQVVAGASGPFSLGSVTTRDRAQKIAIERGSDFGKFRQHSLGNTKPGKLTDESFLKLKPEDLTPDDAYSISSSDSEGPRMDVEYISLLDDTKSDDENGDTKIEPIWGAGAPVRVPRSAHIDRTTQVNTEASSSRKGKIDLGRRGKEVLFEETVKAEDEPPNGGENIALPDVQPSPDAGRKKSVKTQSPEAKTKDVPVKARKRSISRRKKVTVSSPEEREELEREELDRATTLRELVGSVAGVDIDDDGDTGMASDIDQPPHHRNAETENQIFLFQFPNILPQLVLPIKEHKRGDDDVEAPTRSESASEEPPHRLPPRPQTILQRKMSVKAQQVLLESFPPPGVAGKLRIHKSGRMTMLWGNSDSTGENGSPFEMDVARGTQCEFLQELVAMKQHSPWGDQDVDERGKRKGVAFSLGQVKGKFIVSPDFEKLLKGEKKKVGKRKDKVKKGGSKDMVMEMADL